MALVQDTAEENIVAALTDPEGDKYSLLERTLDKARFFEILENAFGKSGKARGEFRIAVKPNISMLLRRSDVGVYTDPFLVIHLLRLLLKRGFTNLVVVESRNLYGNWFANRSVHQVAAREGYLDESVIESYRGEKQMDFRVVGGGVDAMVPIIDLSLDTIEYDFGEPVGKQEVGKTWIEADFRINFAKVKSHFYSYYSLAIKNIYGCLPKQDKVENYHCRRAVGPWTAQLIKHFPVHFSILDGYTASDGWAGVKMKAICNKPHTIVAGADIMAVDGYAAGLLGVDPHKSIMHSSLQKLIPPRPYSVVGNALPFKNWTNPPGIIVWFCKFLDSFANIMDFAGSLATGGHDECFPITLYEGKPLRKLIYYLFIPVNIFLDISLITLKLRERHFSRKIRQNALSLPALTQSIYISDRLKFLGNIEIKKLAEFCANEGSTRAIRSGHYLIAGGHENALPSRLSISNIALSEILNYADANKVDKVGLAKELRMLPDLCPDLFAPDAKYPYCFR